MGTDRFLRLALLGDPVAHSLSPTIHAAALDALGIPGSYEARQTQVADLPGVVDELHSGALHGVNVTMPLKRAALAMCSGLSQDCAMSEAANTLSVADGAVHGDNTDVAALREALGTMPDGPVLVLGAGGAARAALVAAIGRRRFVSARRADAPNAAAADDAVAWGEPVPGAIVVNATPLGMEGEKLPPAVLADAEGLIDLAYGTTPTPAVTAMLGSGRPCVDGITVLVAQAARSFEIWTGIPAPRDVMERAARGQQGAGSR